MYNIYSKKGFTYWSTKLEKGILYKPNNVGENYEDATNNIPSVILDKLTAGFLDDNGDLPHGDCFIIPLSEIGLKYPDEIDEIGDGVYIEYMKVEPILGDGSELDEPSEPYMYFSSRNEIYIKKYEL